MSCYYPLAGKYSGVNKKTHKFKVRILGAYNNQEDCFPIPCGKCIGCRLDYAKQWSYRCMLELKQHDYNKCWFLTLTYNDEHLPPVYIDENTAELSDIHSLRKKDIQDFLKRLRSNIYDRAVKQGIIKNGDPTPDDLKCKFYCAGEYGPKNNRPHYHMILYNVELTDIKLLKYDAKNGYFYYTSDFIQKAWSDPKTKDHLGFIVLTRVTMETCNYVARYILKKQKGIGRKLYDLKLYEPEFTLMSRRPGIGKDYFDENKEKIYEYDSITLSTPDKGYVFKPPRYFDKLFDIEQPDKLRNIKETRKELLENSIRNKLDQTSLSYSDMLKSEEEYKIQKTKILKRKENML